MGGEEAKLGSSSSLIWRKGGREGDVLKPNIDIVTREIQPHRGPAKGATALTDVHSDNL